MVHENHAWLTQTQICMNQNGSRKRFLKLSSVIQQNVCDSEAMTKE